MVGRSWLAAAALTLGACAPGCSTGSPRDVDADAGPDADGDAERDDDGSQDGSADGDWDEDQGDADTACPDGWAETLEPGVEVRLGTSFAGRLPVCASALRFAVVPAGMTVRVEVSDLPAGATVTVAQPSGERLAEREAADGAASVDVAPTLSGEVRVVLSRPDGHDQSRYRGRIACVDRCDLEATRYPIVLVHGMAGADNYFGLFDYFYGVPDLLGETGYLVYTPVTSAVGPSEERAASLAEQVDQILTDTGAAKVHLLGHSQGGLDIRVLMGGLGYGDQTASATTLSSPNAGIRAAVPEWLAGMDFSEEYITGVFAAANPDPAGVPLFSWASRTCPLIDVGCQEELDGERVGALFVASYWVVRDAHEDDEYGGANDGLVPVASAASWGEPLGVLAADHADEIGQIAGATQGPFDHLAFFLSEARRLRQVEIAGGL